MQTLSGGGVRRDKISRLECSEVVLDARMTKFEGLTIDIVGSKASC